MRSVYHILLDWSVRCFGREHVFDKKVRALRLGEESIEYMQARGIDRDQAHKLIDMVYDRPVGQADQELGGVFVTAAVAAIADNWDPDVCFETELRRVLAKSPDHFRQRNEEKNAMGFR